MSFRSLFLSFFPAFTVGQTAIIALLAKIYELPFLYGVAFLSLYLFPLLSFHVHQRLWPMALGPSHLLKASYSPWWGTHQIQLIFIAFPVLEELLRLIPGLFAFWLRLWGAKVGRNVYFTPHFRVADRSLLDIGDDVVFGYQTSISSHIIKKSRRDLLLFVKPVKIGAGVFIGVGVVMGPGVTIEANASIDGGMYLYPNRVYSGKCRRQPHAASHDEPVVEHQGSGSHHETS